MKDEEKYIEIDLVQLLSVLWRKLWIIILCGVIGAAAAFGYTRFFVTPMYQASAMLYINNSKGTVSSETITQSDLTASQSLVDTYVVILNSQTLINKVIEKSGTDRSASAVKGMLSASAVNETEMLKIVITSDDPQEAAELANTFVKESSVMMTETVDNSSVKVVDYASAPHSPSSPNTMKNTAMGLMLGVLLCMAVIVLRELTETVIRSENQLAELFEDIPILGVIPSMKEASKEGYGSRGYSGYGSYSYASQRSVNKLAGAEKSNGKKNDAPDEAAQPSGTNSITESSKDKKEGGSK